LPAGCRGSASIAATTFTGPVSEIFSGLLGKMIRIHITLKLQQDFRKTVNKLTSTQEFKGEIEK